ncbi:MAG: phosphoribosylanthranilate isomerase [Woeseia sp.]
MSCLVKICGLSHLESVRAAVAAGADALGFVFAESARQVTARQAALIASRVPRNILRVAVMRHPTAEQWREVEEIFCPDVLQTDAGDFDHLEVSADIVRWPVIREGALPSAPLPELFLYEGTVSGRGERVDWEAAAGIARKGRMILAGGLDSRNVASAMAQVRPYGVDVSSAVETAPGLKDAELIHEFVAAVRTAERAAQRDAGMGPDLGQQKAVGDPAGETGQ